MPGDKCRETGCCRQGVPGNENVMPDGRIVCDYCHAKILEERGRAECERRGIDPEMDVDLNCTTSRFLIEQGLEPEWELEDGAATLDVYMHGPAWMAFTRICE
jgi:hypothetical protein